jgi:hypothetical protein
MTWKMSNILLQVSKVFVQPSQRKVTMPLMRISKKDNVQCCYLCLTALCKDTRLSLPRSLEVTFFSVGTQSHSLHVEERITSFMQPGGGDPDRATTSQRNPQIPSGVVKRVRVLLLLKGKKESKHTTLLFYGPVADLTFDPTQYCWSDGSPLMDYSAKKGRELLNQNTLNDSPATGKWVGVLPANFRFEWKKTVRQDAGPEGIDSYLAHVEPGGCR